MKVTYKIENIMVFMSDALRWDYTPRYLFQEGASFKTISAGTSTPSSVTSMLTGVYPQKHGVFSFKDVCPPTLPSLLDLEGYDIGFYNCVGAKSGVNSILRRKLKKTYEQKALDDLVPPFIYFERDYGPHHPYYGLGYTGSLQEFIKEFSKSTEKIRRKYSDAVEASVRRFESRLEVLERKGILNDTLVIFTADHGELLGEYGLVGHSGVPCPELVYVPTIFIHRSLPRGMNGSIMRHIDLFPTVLALLGKEMPDQCEGTNVFLEPVKVGYTCFLTLSRYLKNRLAYRYEASGAWTKRGGHVFNQTTLFSKFLRLLSLLTKSTWCSVYLRKHLLALPKAIGRNISKYTEFGEPDITREEALRYIEQIEGAGIAFSEKITLEEEVKKRLRDLGYLE